MAADVRSLRPRRVRTRIALASVAVVALVLTVASIGLVLAQRALLTRGLDDVLMARAEALAETVRAGGDPADEPGRGAWQITRDGEVTAQSAGLAALDRPLRVASVEVGDGSVVRAVASLDEVLDAADVLAGSLAVVVPLVALVLGAGVWVMVGRTLRPVEDIRTEVAAIGATDLHRRVPDPGTGDEIGRLAATMNDMLDRLERSVDAQRRFVADASHELRSPITRIRTQLEVADVGDDVEVLRASLLEDTGELADLVDALLFLARTDAIDAPLADQPVDLDDVVLREVARARGGSGAIIDASQVSGAEVRGDAAALGRAVRNLLDNALRHAASRVEVTLGTTDGVVRLVVGDDGPGIPAQDAERVFDRFTRLDEARTRDGGGAGLGLAIVREVVERHGGRVVLGRSDAGGASLTLELPPPR